MKISRAKLTIIILILLSSCVEKKEGEKYETRVRYNDNFKYHDPQRDLKRTEKYLNKDTLYIFFETYYDSDTIEVKVNNRLDTTAYLTTNESLGLATLLEFGEISEINKIQISKNRGKPLIIDLSDKKMNIWTVGFYSDTLYAQRVKHLPIYE